MGENLAGFFLIRFILENNQKMLSGVERFRWRMDFRKTSCSWWTRILNSFPFPCWECSPFSYCFSKIKLSYQENPALSNCCCSAVISQPLCPPWSHLLLTREIPLGSPLSYCVPLSPLTSPCPMPFSHICSIFKVGFVCLLTCLFSWGSLNPNPLAFYFFFLASPHHHPPPQYI